MVHGAWDWLLERESAPPLVPFTISPRNGQETWLSPVLQGGVGVKWALI